MQGRKKTETFTVLRHDMLDSSACLLLSPGAFRLLISFRRLWMCVTHNEQFWRVSVPFTWTSCPHPVGEKAYRRHREELIEKGFIEVVSKKAGYYRASDDWKGYEPSKEELNELQKRAQDRAGKAGATAQYRERMLRPKGTSLGRNGRCGINPQDQGEDLDLKCRESNEPYHQGVRRTQEGGGQYDALSITNSTENTPPTPHDPDDDTSTPEAASIGEKRGGDESALGQSKSSRTGQSSMVTAEEPGVEQGEEAEWGRATHVLSPGPMPDADDRTNWKQTRSDGTKRPAAPPDATPMRQEHKGAAYEERRKQAPRELRAIFRQRITDEPYLSHQENFDIAEGLFQQKPYYQFIVDWMAAMRDSDGQSAETKESRLAEVIRQHLEPHSNPRNAKKKVLAVLCDPQFNLELVRDAVVGIINDVDTERRSQRQTIHSPLSLLHKRTEKAYGDAVERKRRRGSEPRWS